MMILHYITSPRMWLQVIFLVLTLLGMAQVYWVSVEGVQHALRPLYLSANATLRRESSHDPWDEDAEGGGGQEDLAWLLHVSDLHVSKFQDMGRQTDLRSLLRFAAKSVRPSAVLVTGDLTDSKTKDHVGSAQIRDEWIAYHGIVSESGIIKVSRFLDVRGNHDDFDVLSHEDENNFFRRFSVQGKDHPGSFLETWRENASSFGVVAIDASPYPGLKRPFNFFGTVFTRDLEELRSMSQVALEQDNTLFIGHYPTSAITVQGLRNGGIRDVMAGSVYLCGHYHTALNFNRQMFSRHRNGLLELEMGDWKDNRRFRILTFDKRFLSFEDFTFDSRVYEEGNAVFTVVTNPKNPMAFRESENLFALRKAKTIRVLVFAESKIRKVEFEIDFSSEKHEMRAKTLPGREIQPLYVAGWEPSRFTEGLHTLSVFVTLENGFVAVSNHSFSLDGSQPEYSLLARIILMNNWLPFTQIIFAALALAIVGALFVLRVAHGCCLRADRPKFRISFYPQVFQIFMYALKYVWLVAVVNGLCWPVVGFVIYVCFGPVALAQVLTSRYGVIFSWGIILQDGTYTPPDTIFAYGFFTLVLHGLFILCLGSKVAKKFDREAALLFQRENARLVLSRERNRHRGDIEEEPSWIWVLGSKVWRNVGHLCFVAIVGILLLNCRSLWASYGFVSMVSPIGLGRLVFYVWLYIFQANKISPPELACLVKIWG